MTDRHWRDDDERDRRERQRCGADRHQAQSQR
jgi:hypothetical protein